MCAPNPRGVGGWPGRGRVQLALDESLDGRDGAEVLRHGLVVADLDAVGLLEVGDQLEHPERVQSLRLEQRQIVGDLAVQMRRTSLPDDEVPDAGLDAHADSPLSLTQSAAIALRSTLPVDVLGSSFTTSTSSGTM